MVSERTLVEMPLVSVFAYTLPDGSTIERCDQKNGDKLWAVRKFGGCLNHDGFAEDEPQPSSRDAAFLARCRFNSAEEAYETWAKAQA